MGIAKQDAVSIAVAQLLAPASLDVQGLQRVFSALPTAHCQYADIYLQRIEEESWSLEDGRVKDAQYERNEGFGLRIIDGEKVGFAYADGIASSTMSEALNHAKSVIRQGQSADIPIIPTSPLPVASPLYPSANPLDSLDAEDKIALLQSMDRRARAADPRITRVNVSLTATHEVVMIFNAQGELSADVRPLVSLHVDVVAQQGPRIERGHAGGGARALYATFSHALAGHYVDEAVRKALLNLEAISPPAGTMPVVLGPGWPAVLLHEAVGHGLEADACRRGSSVFSNRIGEMVASPLCTIVDDGTLSGRRGSLGMDDEGIRTSCTTLIEEGQLVGYMQDRHNAHLMGVQPTGNGRRESYAYRPIPRMTNTYMLNGTDSPEAIVASLEDGLYAVDFSGGQVDVTSGQFVFTTSEAYWVKGGKIVTPVKDATLIGKGSDVLKQLTMVGDDMALDSGIGVCGKQGQCVPVGVGQPTVKLAALTVGGTNSS